MRKPSATFLTLMLSLATLSACGKTRLEQQLNHAKYWKRTDVREVTYINGRTAQKRLNQDLANCVMEIRQARRSQALRDTIPANIYGLEDQYGENYKDELSLNKHDTPERDGALRAEHTNYHNFESCMFDKGWSRTAYVTFDTEVRARKAYLSNIGYEENETRLSQQRRKKQQELKSTNNPDFVDLNE